MFAVMVCVEKMNYQQGFISQLLDTKMAHRGG